MSHVTCRETAFHVKEAGSASQPLLLIHGTGGNADVWEPVLPGLAEHFRAIAYDRRGFSRSPGSNARRDYFRSHADDASSLLGELNASPASVCGWSGGAIVALALAAYHPSAVSSLVLYEPPLHAKRHLNLALVSGFAQVFAWRLLRRPAAGARSFYRMAMYETDGRNAFDRLSPQVRESLLSNAAGVFTELDGGTGEELSADLIRGIRCPITFIVGGRTAPFIAKAAERLIALRPDMRVVREPDVGHMMPIDQPGRFVGLVRDAITLSPPAAA